MGTSAHANARRGGKIYLLPKVKKIFDNDQLEALGQEMTSTMASGVQRGMKQSKKREA